MTKGPVLIDLEEEGQGTHVAEAPPVPDLGLPAPEGQAMPSLPSDPVVLGSCGGGARRRGLGGRLELRH